jgi:hypothetical protein
MLTGVEGCSLPPPRSGWAKPGPLLSGLFGCRLHCLGILQRGNGATAPAPSLLLVNRGKLLFLGHRHHLLSLGSVWRRFDSHCPGLAEPFPHSGKLLFQLLPVASETLQPLFIGQESAERRAAPASAASAVAACQTHVLVTRSGLTYPGSPPFIPHLCRFFFRLMYMARLREDFTSPLRLWQCPA